MSSKKTKILCAIILLATIFVLTSRNLNGYFVKDDFTLIYGSHNKGPEFFMGLFHKDWLAEFLPGLAPIWKGEGRGMIRPIMGLSFKLNYLLNGTQPLGYHLFNIFFHFANAFLVFLIVDFLISDKLLGLVTALLFAVHPAHSPGVAWIAGSAELMAAFCYLSCFYLFIKYRANHSKPYYFLSLFIFLFGLFTKETMATLPMLLVGYDLLQELSSKPETILLLLKRMVKKSLALVPYALLVSSYLVVRKLAFGAFVGGYTGHFKLELTAKIINLLGYLRFAFSASPWDYPTHLYSRPTPLTAGEIFILAFLFCFLLLPSLFIGIRHMAHFRLFALGAGWCLVSCIPVVVAGTQLVYIFPLYLYLVVVGLSCALAALLFSWYGRKVALALAVVLMLLYGTYQFKYNFDWRYAGFICRQTVGEMNAAARKIPQGNTIILIDIPQVFNTAWVFSGNLQDALRRPFAETDIVDAYKIKVFSSEEAKEILNGHGAAEGLDLAKVKKILEGTPMPRPWFMGRVTDAPITYQDAANHSIHLYKWDSTTERLEELSDLASLLP